MLQLSNLHGSGQRKQQFVVLEITNSLHGERLRILRRPIHDVLIAGALIEHIAAGAGVHRDLFLVAPHAVHAASIAEVA